MTNRKQAKEWLFLMVFIIIGYLFSHSANTTVADAASIFLRTFLVLYCISRTLKAIFMLLSQNDEFDDEGSGSAFLSLFGWVTAFLIVAALFWGILKASEKSCSLPVDPDENVLSLEGAANTGKNTTKSQKATTKQQADTTDTDMPELDGEKIKTLDPDTEYVIINDPLDDET